MGTHRHQNSNHGAWMSLCFLAYMLLLLACCFVGTPDSVSQMSLTLSLALAILFSPIGLPHSALKVKVDIFYTHHQHLHWVP